jgi:hypothetical protein
MNILFLYNAHQTFTNTVFEHLAAFQKHSRHTVRFCHIEPFSRQSLDLTAFDAICIHYSLRLPFDELSARMVDQIGAFQGARALFIQDEYDHTNRAREWIRRCRFTDIFTLVPRTAIGTVYPADKVGPATFHSVLSGYVPDDLPDGADLPLPSQRQVMIGYRARQLPVRYGALGFDKVNIGRDVRAYCLANNIPHDISWLEHERIYGPEWLAFLGSCRATLGSESGCNVFDWDGDLDRRVAAFRQRHRDATEGDVYDAIIRERELPDLMNQVSPRIFESIAMRSVLVLYEGSYSGVVEAGRHFLALRRDLRNIRDVFRQLDDPVVVDGMAERAYDEVIRPGRFAFSALVAQVDAAIEARVAQMQLTPHASTDAVQPPDSETSFFRFQARYTEIPVRAERAYLPTDTLRNTLRGAASPRQLAVRLTHYIWAKVPMGLRIRLKPMIRRLRRQDA